MQGPKHAATKIAVPPGDYGLFCNVAGSLRHSHALVSSSLCRFRVPRELHSNQGLMKLGLQRLGMNKTRNPRVLYHNCREAAAEGRHVAREGLEFGVCM
jgi:hypothetical protein